MWSSRTRARAASLAALPALALALAGCGSTASSSTDQVSVVAAFYPLEWAVAQVGGDRVSVTSLTAPGAEPHDLELTPQQVATVSDSRLVVYIRGFQPSVDDAAAAHPETALDVSTAPGITDTPSGSAAASQQATSATPPRDPHIWLDPVNMAAIITAVAARLTAVDPASAALYAANAEAVTARLRLLDKAWRTGTTTCASRDLVVSHDAFGYLAQRYGFTQIGISGLSPDAEPSPSKIAEVTDFVRTHNVTTIYYETLVDPKVAQTIASETGATTAVLDPLEGAPKTSGRDYVDVMTTNLATVRQGQSCT